MMPSITNWGAESKAEKGRLRELKTVARYLKPYGWQIAGAVLALLVTSSAVLSLGAALRYLIDYGLSRGDTALLDRAYITLLGVVAVLAVASYARFFLVAWLGEKVIADIRRDVYRHLVSLHIGFFETAKTGEILSRLTTDTTLLQTIIGGSISVALRNSIMLVGGCIMLLATSPKLTMYVLAIVPFVVAPIIIFGRRVRRYSRDSQDRVADISAHGEETLNAIRTIQALTLEDYERGRFETHIQNVLKAGLNRIQSKAVLTSVVITMVFGAIVTVLWMGGHDVLAGRMTGGDLSAFVFYSAIVAGAVGALSEVMSDLQRASGAAERIGELVGLSPAISVVPPIEQLGQASPEIRFDHVTFTYPARLEKPALHDIDFTVKPGETVAVVGPSGAGKTTIFQMLLRFYDPQQGTIMFAGHDIRHIEPKELRAQFGIVPQEAVIFSGSIAENILTGKPDATKEEIRYAAEVAMVAEFADRLPLGFATPVGEKGVQLSGGQRQRIAIARAVIRNPKVLLLDEATSALDAENERLVQQAIERVMQGRTTLVIAHRLSTVIGADRILLMEEGRIAAIGSHAELMRSNELYARLAKLQLEHDFQAA